jgi:hypothetical protein
MNILTAQTHIFSMSLETVHDVKRQWMEKRTGIKLRFQDEITINKRRYLLFVALDGTRAFGEDCERGGSHCVEILMRKNKTLYTKRLKVSS